VKLTPRHKAFHIVVFGAIAIVAVFIILVGKDYARDARVRREEAREREEALREIEETERLLAEDTYGGATPEETFQMFLDALRAGDVDLASKYFVAEKQESWKENFEKIRSSDYLDDMISDLEKATLDKTESNLAWMSLPGKDVQGNSIYSRISFSKNQSSNKWKIDAL